MGAFVGKEENWKQFEALWGEELDRHPNVEFIHAKHLVPKRDIYRDWSDDDHRTFINRLIGVMVESGVVGMVAALSNDDYAAIRPKFKAKPKMRTDSAYGLCFRVCMVNLARLTASIIQETGFPLLLNKGTRTWVMLIEFFIIQRRHHHDIH